MKYHYNIIQHKPNNIVLQLTDIPQVINDGTTTQQAIHNTTKTLLSYINYLFSNNQHIPTPQSTPNHNSISLPLSTSSKILLLNTITDTNTPLTTIQSKLNLNNKQLLRLTNINTYTPIDTIELAIQACNKKLIISLT